MITMASIIERFESAFLAQYHSSMLPSQRHALAAMKMCRSTQGPSMLVQCNGCQERRLVPHSCGHRNCPHCQNYESQQWIERQTKLLVPGSYFLITFTVPAELRPMVWQNQKTLYALLMQCAWETLCKFSKNHKQLQGIPGAVAVLHTHSRSLDFHPHVHLVMPAAALDVDKRLWRSLKPKTKWYDYLFCQKALAIVFRAKLLAAMRKAGMTPPSRLPDEWVANCKCVGTGEKALVYLGRYLYRGVIQEKDIIACANGQVTYRWRNSETKKMQKRTVSGTTFLHLVLQHVLSKGFRRARNYGFLHPNSKKMIALLQLLVFKHSVPTKTQPIQSERPPWLCTCCGGMMVVLKRSILPPSSTEQPSHNAREWSPKNPPSELNKNTRQRGVEDSFV